MIRKDFIISKTRNYLTKFIDPIAIATDKPRQKFLRQVLGAILLSGSLVVMEFSRLIHDDCSDIFYRLKRLLSHLQSPRADLSKVVRAYREQMAGYIKPDTPLIIDMTDIAKPRARRMKYLAQVRDGSENKLVNGYWCIEVYAYAKGKKVIPLSLDVFGIDDPSVGSQNLQIERNIDAVNKVFDGNGIWLADRGFDGLNLYEMWFSRRCRFIVRQRGDRYVLTANGVRILERDLLEHLRRQWLHKGRHSDIVFCKVKLPDHNQHVYLIACWREKSDNPLILLTNLVVENERLARQIISYYKKRWSCEETIQFLKGRVGLERFRIRRYEAIKRLMILAMLAMGFLTWILLKNRQLTKYLFSLTSRFRKERKFIYYLLLDGLQELSRLCQLCYGELLLEPVKNG
ncbi:MAG: transposase [Phycisphaerae bacterium]|nr:transposase [Phycisphaerae bacterium]NIP54004.1 transposase [Phycisphaerae bacterium]NIS51313.1 transposase [Phycisphaerae bacterium]NIU10406.1 transposase [Phycisphaerae bacterium]NIU58104.1 transposase [Phycisphaerae bacterium]